MRTKVFFTVLLLALLACLPALAAGHMAALCFTSHDNTQYYWGTNTDVAWGVNANVTGDGLYTVSVTASSPIKDLYFSQLIISGAEKQWPNSTIQITSVRVDGEKIKFTKGFTSSADGEATIISMWDPWFEGFSEEYHPRSFDGILDGANFVMKQSDFLGARNIEVQFLFSTNGSQSQQVTAPSSDDITAFIGIRNRGDSLSYWGYDNEHATGLTATVDGDGLYTVSANFDSPLLTVYFAQVVISNAEKKWPNSTIQVTSVKIDGKKVSFSKGFTFSEDGISTCISLWDPWFSGFNPAYNNRSFDGSLRGADFVLKEGNFIGHRTFEVQFLFSTNQ